jgi:hypothetical protein
MVRGIIIALAAIECGRYFLSFVRKEAAMPESSPGAFWPFSLTRMRSRALSPTHCASFRGVAHYAKAKKNASWASQTISPTWGGTLIVRTPQC